MGGPGASALGRAPCEYAPARARHTPSAPGARARRRVWARSAAGPARAYQAHSRRPRCSRSGPGRPARAAARPAARSACGARWRTRGPPAAARCPAPNGTLRRACRRPLRGRQGRPRRGQQRQGCCGTPLWPPRPRVRLHRPRGCQCRPRAAPLRPRWTRCRWAAAWPRGRAARACWPPPPSSRRRRRCRRRRWRCQSRCRTTATATQRACVPAAEHPGLQGSAPPPRSWNPARLLARARARGRGSRRARRGRPCQTRRGGPGRGRRPRGLPCAWAAARRPPRRRRRCSCRCRCSPRPAHRPAPGRQRPAAGRSNVWEQDPRGAAGMPDRHRLYAVSKQKRRLCA